MEQDRGTGISQLFTSTEFLTRRIDFHVARHPDAHSTALTELEPLNTHFLAEGCSRGGPESFGMKGSGKVSLPASKSGSASGNQSAATLVDDVTLTWPSVRKIGAGLTNLGNTCFLNSVLQCLTYTTPLAVYLESGQHSASCRAVGFCALCIMEKHVKKALTSHGQVISPRQMVQNLRCIGKSFRPQRQEDAHEFARYLIEAMQRSSLPPGTPSSSKATERTMMFRVFGGRLCSQVKCTKCSYCSNTFDPFLDLSLEVMQANSLLKALRRFTATEVLDGANKYKCSACKTKVQAFKRLTIDRVPNVLAVQFKRFDGAGMFGGKIDKHIQFDTTLDLTPFMSNTQHVVNAKYSLYGVLVHAGATTHSGHYYCFVRSSASLWHVMDDSRVRQVSESGVLSQNAYMLFYVRQADRPRVPSIPPATSPKVAAPSQAAPNAEAPSPQPLSVATSVIEPGMSPKDGSMKLPNAEIAASRYGKGPDSDAIKAMTAESEGAVVAHHAENGHARVQPVTSAGAKDGTAPGPADGSDPVQRDAAARTEAATYTAVATVNGVESADCNGAGDGSMESGRQAAEKGEKERKRKAEWVEDRFLAAEEEEEMQRETSSSTSASDDEGASSGTGRRRKRQSKCLWDFHYSQIWPPKTSLMRLLSVNPRTRRIFARWRNRRLRKLASILSADMQPIMTRAARRAAAHENTGNDISGDRQPLQRSPKKMKDSGLDDDVALAELADDSPTVPFLPAETIVNGHEKKQVHSKGNRAANGDVAWDMGSPAEGWEDRAATVTRGGRSTGKGLSDSEDEVGITKARDARDGRGSLLLNGGAAMNRLSENGALPRENGGHEFSAEKGGDAGKMVGNGKGVRVLEDTNGVEGVTRGSDEVASMGLEQRQGEDGDGGNKKVVRLPFAKAKGGPLYGVAVSAWGEGEEERTREKDLRLLARADQAPRKRQDEWDEEYDRGKTKKVKRKNLDGNSNEVRGNPFQRAAESKVLLKV